MKNKSIYFLLVLSWSLMGHLPLHAQIGGKKVFTFLNLPSSARVTALGGTLTAVLDDDVALADQNPALLDSSMHNQLSFNHNFHLADIANGMFSYGHHINKWGITTHAGIQYTSYGDFVAANSIGDREGTFSASEMAMVIGAGKKLNERMHVGVNLIGISANYESYASTGIATDLGATYHNPESRFVASFTIKSLGVQLSDFDDQKEGLPLNIQLGIAKRLKHLPFRFSVTAQNLQQWNVRYDDPNQVQSSSIFDETPETSASSKAIDNFFRHMVFSGEFLLGKSENLRLRFGYNHLRRQELRVSQFKSLGGFSLGFGLKVYKFRIDYGVGFHHLAGGNNHLTLSTNLSEYRKKI